MTDKQFFLRTSNATLPWSASSPSPTVLQPDRANSSFQAFQGWGNRAAGLLDGQLFLDNLPNNSLGKSTRLTCYWRLSSTHWRAITKRTDKEQCCQVPVFVRIPTEIRSVFRSTETQWSTPQIESIKNESTSAPAVVLTGLHHDQRPCPIESQMCGVQIMRLAEEGEKRC